MTPRLIPHTTRLFLLLAALALLTPPLVAQMPPGSLLWLRADSGVVHQTGRVERWHDASGNGNGAWQDTSAKRPTLIYNASGSLPAVRFSGAGDFMHASSVFPTSSDYSLLFVVRVNNMAATNNVLSGNSHAHWFGGNADAKVLHGNFATQAISSIPIAPSEFTIVTMTFLQARQRAVIYINGLFADSAFVGTNTDPTMYLGAYAQANVLNGDIAEVLLYPRELEAIDRVAAQTYLSMKYKIALASAPPPPDTTFREIPRPLQFYARDNDDSARVAIAGSLPMRGFDSIYVRIDRDRRPWKRIASRLTYAGGRASFTFMPTIHAALSEYRFTVGVSSTLRDSVIAVRDSIVCGDVFFINGQSNSIFGNGRSTTYEFCRTFGVNYSQRKHDTSWSLARSDGNGGGPFVGALGLRMQKLLVDYTGVPMCVINGGVGGTPIEQHQRVDVDPASPTSIYGSMLYRARISDLAAKAKAMIWYQGESNSITGYYENFKSLYEDWREDYPALKKFYVVQMRPGCGAGEHRALRDLQRTLGDSLPNIVSYSTMAVPGHDGCHFNATGYDTIGTHIYRLVARDFYGLADTVDIGSPNVRKAFYTDATHSVLALVFSNARNGLVVTSDTTIAGVAARIAESFTLDDSLAPVSVRVSADTAYLTLSAPFAARSVSYIPNVRYSGTSVIYDGPWLKNRRGLGAFSFFNVPITAAAATSRVSDDATMGIAPNPFDARTTVTFSVQQPIVVTLNVYDAIGRIVLRRDIDAAAGVNRFQLDGSELPSGVYQCVIGGDRLRQRRSVIVAR